MGEHRHDGGNPLGTHLVSDEYPLCSEGYLTHDLTDSNEEDALMKTTPVKALLILAASGLVFGCATTQQKELQSQLDEVRAMAEKAAADAAAAQSTANTAMDTANAAKAQSEQSEAKIDRMFKKAMYK